jgi:hypothetical protein
MRHLLFQSFLQLEVFVVVTFSATVYITDLPVFSALGQYFHSILWLETAFLVPISFDSSSRLSVSLKNYHPDLNIAPCAGSAVSAVVQGLTQESCAPSVTALESCACTQDKNSAAVVGSISTYVLNYCGSTAAEDVTSADKVFGAYCNQATPATIPTGGPVTQYITDLPAYSELGGCGQSALSYAVQSLTDTKCPPAASLLVSTSVGPCLRSNSSASNLTQTGKLCLQQRPKCAFHQRTN